MFQTTPDDLDMHVVNSFFYLFALAFFGSRSFLNCFKQNFLPLSPHSHFHSHSLFFSFTLSLILLFVLFCFVVLYRMLNADPSKVSARAKKRGLPQLGTLGAGNHYTEVTYIYIYIYF
jgi:hypothetical protein